MIHTVYLGKGPNILDYRSAGLTPVVFSQLKRVSNVVALDAAYDDVSGTATFTAEEQSDFVLALAEIDALSKLISKDVYALLTQEPLHGLMNIFLNAQVRENKGRSSVSDLLR